MNVRDTVEELTQTCIEIRERLTSLSSDLEAQEELILRHIKCFTTAGVRINDFRAGLEWFNVAEALSIHRHLAGKIMILDFFTYCCINCMHVLPDLALLEKQVSIADGLVVVGVHCAKFSNEKDSKKVLSAVQRYNITHPVVNDTALSMWRALGISCWPTLVMIGPMGELLAVFVGEGHRSELMLYVNVALNHYKRLNVISGNDIPLQLAQHLLPVAGKESLLFPSKLEVIQDEQGEWLVIADTGNHRILVTDARGNVKHVIGGPDPGFVNGDFRNAKFNAPQGVCALGNCIYLADNENHAIRKIDMIREIVTTVVGTGSQGHDYVGGKVGTKQVLSSPWDVAVYNHIYNEMIVPVLLIANAGTHQIWALFLNDTIWWKNSEYKAGTCAAIVGSGREENRNNAYPHTAGLAQPSGLVVVSESKLAFFADSESSAIRCINLQNGQVSAVCGANRDPMDLHGFGDSDGKLYAAKLQHPLGITWHPRKKVLYVADTYNHKIKMIDTSTLYCKTLFGNREPNDQFSFDEPSGLAINSDGNVLYVADTNNHAVKAIDMENGNIKTLLIELPMGQMDNNLKTIDYTFDTAISENGGELKIVHGISFLEGDLKLNANAPQKWTVHLPTSNDMCNIGRRSGEISKAAIIQVLKGSGMHEIYVILDIVACTSTECLLKSVSVLYRVHRKADAPTSVTEQRHLIVK